MLFKATVVVAVSLFFILADLMLGTSILTANIKSGLLVIIGPLLSAMVAYRLPAIRSLFHSLCKLYGPGESANPALIQELERVAYQWRAGGYRALEKATWAIADPFLRSGVELVADGYQPEEIKKMLNRQCRVYFAGRSAEGNILGALAKQAQTFGYIGTVIGIMSVLGDIGNTTAIGNGLAMALLSTIYGLLLANLVYLPLHEKFKARLGREYKSHLLVIDGVNSLACGKSSRAIAYRLQSFLDEEEKPTLAEETIISMPQHRLAA